MYLDQSGCELISNRLGAFLCKHWRFLSKIFVVHNVVSEGVGVCGWQQGGADQGHLKQEPQTHPEQKHLQPVGYKTSYL